MIDVLVYLAVFVIVIVLIWWLMQQVTLPEPINKIALIVFVVVAAVVLIGILLQLTGHGSLLHLSTR